MFAINERKQSESKIERCIAQRTLHSHKGETNGILKFKTGDHIHAYGIYDRKNKKILPFNRDRHHHIIEDGESAGEFWYGALVDKKVDLQQEEEETGSSKNNNKQEIEELEHMKHDPTAIKGWFPRTSVHISHSHSHGKHFGQEFKLSKKQIKKIKKFFNKFVEEDRPDLMDVRGLQKAINSMAGGTNNRKINKFEAQEMMKTIDHTNKGHIHFDDFCEIIRLRMESERQKQIKKEIRAAIILQRYHRRRMFHVRCKRRKALFTGKEKLQMSLYKMDALKVLRAKEFIVKEYKCTFEEGPMGFGVDRKLYIIISILQITNINKKI